MIRVMPEPTPVPKTAGPPTVTAVVLNWCDYEATAACLETLRAAAYPALSVLLVDNGSPDGSGDALRKAFPEVGFLQTGENLGYTGGNNRGIERALDERADYVLVLNHDTAVEPEAVARLVERAEGDPAIGAAAPTVVAMDDPDHAWYAGGVFDPLRALGVHWNGNGGENAGREVTFFCGCSVLLRREALLEVGGFAESYFLYVEDAELSVRLRKAGWRIVHEPRARVRHHLPPEGEEPTPLQIRYRDRNRRRLAREHLGPARRAAFWAWFYPTRAVHLARYLLKGDTARARAIVQGIRER